MIDHCCERERDQDTERERIYAARQAISDARLLLQTAIELLERKDSEERPCRTE